MYANLHNPARCRAVGEFPGLYGRNSEPLKRFKLQLSNTVCRRSVTTPRDFVLSYNFVLFAQQSTVGTLFVEKDDKRAINTFSFYNIILSKKKSAFDFAYGSIIIQSNNKATNVLLTLGFPKRYLDASLRMETILFK